MSRLLQILIFGVAFVTMYAGCRVNTTCAPNLGCDPSDLVPNSGPPEFIASDRAPCLDEEDCLYVDTVSSPLDMSDYASISYHEVTLQDCINAALQNSKVFRDLGGNIIRSPESATDIYDPADVSTDPQFSEEAALAVFDASFNASGFFQNNDRPANLIFQGQNGILQQDANQMSIGFQKLAATGTFFAVRHGINYDNSNQTGTVFGPKSWEAILEGEFRHPLLQGGGTQFNRIAGPSREPGVYNGVLIARTNTEISLLAFQKGVRDLVSEVENAYWDLYFAYRNLEANIEGRDKAFEILKQTEADQREGSQARAQANEQYQRFRAVVLDAMEGRLTVGTRNNNGTASGVFQSSGGVRVAERRLRLMTGMPINGQKLLKPSEEPAAVGIEFDWHQIVAESFANREEIVQQKWLIKQKQLELVASKNFLQPRLDLIGQYRLRGVGEDLLGGSRTFQEQVNNAALTSTAYGDLLGRDFQEWQMGAELSIPIGYRRAHLGVRNAELEVARQNAILREQKREVVYGLSNAISEMRRAYTAMKAAEERFVAAKEFQYVMTLEVERGRDRDIELEAQRRVVESEIQFRQAQVEYVLAIKNVHVEKGTFLNYCNVRLNESISNAKAIRDASEKSRRSGAEMSYVTQGPIIGHVKPTIGAEIPFATDGMVTDEPIIISNGETPNAGSVLTPQIQPFTPAPVFQGPGDSNSTMPVVPNVAPIIDSSRNPQLFPPITQGGFGQPAKPVDLSKPRISEQIQKPKAQKVNVPPIVNKFPPVIKASGPIGGAPKATKPKVNLGNVPAVISESTSSVTESKVNPKPAAPTKKAPANELPPIIKKSSDSTPSEPLKSSRRPDNQSK